MTRWIDRIREPSGAVPAKLRWLLIWGGGGVLVLAVGWSTWQQETAAPPPVPNPAEAQPPPSPVVMDRAETTVRASIRDLDEAEQRAAIEDASRRLAEQKKRRALQAAVGTHLRDPESRLAPSDYLPAGEYAESDVVEEEIRQLEARRRYESLRSPQIVLAAAKQAGSASAASAPEGRDPEPAPASEPAAPGEDGQKSAEERLYESLARALEDPEQYGQILHDGTAPDQPAPVILSGGTPTPSAADTPATLVEPRDPDGWERVYEGEFLECVLITQLRGDFPGPANAMVAVDMWSRDRQRIVVPRGSRVLGTASAVSQWGQARLGVAFHRLIYPDGRYVSLDQFTGLNQVGETGLKDKVNNHYASVFGAAAAVGVLSGLAAQDTAAFVGASDRIRSGTGAGVAQQGMAITERFLNRLPTVTIRAGHRVRVYFTSDVLVPGSPDRR